MTINFLAMGLTSFGWGMLMDRFGPRIVVLCGSFILGLGPIPVGALVMARHL
jgi:MFS family permease